MKQRSFSPESLMMSYGYEPSWSEGSVKCPVFQTSTFEFTTAEQGKAYFELAYGLREPRRHEQQGMIYSRINNPNMEILEERLRLWDGAEACAAFESGMSAISTVLLEFLRPGDLLLFGTPLYGGTHHFIHHVLTKFGIHVRSFTVHDTEEQLEQILQESGLAHRLGMIYLETPANPTNDLLDIDLMARLARRHSSPDRPVYLAVDNTYMGPLWQQPLQHGADLVLYSATKYIGGHSDLIAGAVLGSRELIGRVKGLRTFLGNMIAPYTSWLLLRSLETLKVRMEQQARNAEAVATYLRQHPKVARVYYLPFLAEEDPRQHRIWSSQCKGGGAMLSFDIRGGEAEAFAFLNHLQLIKLAVSLGSTESLAEHPATMTHVDIPADEKQRLNITPSLIRLSVGVENSDDLIWDVEQALAAVPVARPQAATLV